MDAFARFDLGGRTALVTGASRGLGEAISYALAASLVTGHTLLVDRGGTAR